MPRLARLRQIRVQSVPVAHPYLEHIRSGKDPSPRPQPIRNPLDPDDLAAGLADVDLLHVHFGFEALPVATLAQLLGLLRYTGRPLVYTAHDLRNPHLHDQRHHLAQLDLLMAAAAAVITLTPGAAAEIRRRWGRDSVVIGHPHVAPLTRIGAARPTTPAGTTPAGTAPQGTTPAGAPTIGVHLKSLRAATDARVVPALVEAVRRIPGARLRVDVHAEAMRPDFVRHDGALARRLREWQARGAIELAVHPRFSDEQLMDYLTSLDVSVLPYRSGTHSGWAELCHDLGTRVVAPDHGHWAEQQPMWIYHTTDGDGPDATGLAAAIEAAWTAPVPRPSAVERAAQREEIARRHLAVYEAVLEGERL